ncbi:uncharacterized protein LOC133531034 isoform X2 [Cydia pomonella]|uniref:uncharacterized protein LOC133531034 isoform X2 n=1 Tax=Cydia pomonella TaxID=82600 RepID=UPI002ADE01C5|nr:uncharacterized protein LOC133531034 isoform X2 [Cydia pomonella]XP_061725103.1 uncharacterized protein LOC133531034 isoform X2 [Cydia pomonella]
MTPLIKLSGNLGQRHRSFNTLVHDAYLQNTPISDQKFPEESALDRLFKIDLASKKKNIDYIIGTLKDDDMLYVSRALKSLWLLDPEHSKIINPSFLEHELFPQMTLPAVNKMRHWIQMHLKDPQRCKEFYQFYKDRNFDIAAKFLWHCSNEYVLGEFSDILDKITPKLLKRLSEKSPQITKIYYDNLKDDQKILKYYLENDSKFFDTVKYLLKSDADVFFYIIENFFLHQKFSAMNAAFSKYIMRNHKNRFQCKPELYTVWFLDMKTVAQHLSPEEIKDVVLKLARAEYLKSWFTYQNVEPLIKRLSKDERTVFKKLVFVDKAFGATVKEWPYPIPIPPRLPTSQTSLFDDASLTFFDLYYDEICLTGCEMSFRAKRKPAKWKCEKTLLDQLFNNYRFSNYKQTYNELKKQLRAESSPQNRQYMLLVLVSKTGGRTEDLVSLLDLLSQYKNEPIHIRAAIIRSLVKRAFVWRLPSEHWARLLGWGHGLGLDGSDHEADCREGLHAVVIRDLLANVKPSQAVWEKFLSDFETLKEYSLTVEERSRVSARLPALLLEDAQSEPEKPKLKQLQYLLNTLSAYCMRYDYYPGTTDAIESAVKYYWNSDDELRRDTEWLLSQLYGARVARKHFIKEFFEMCQTDESYVNALRHDVSILKDTEKLEKIIDAKNLQHERFFQKLAVFYMEKDGLGERYRVLLEHRATSEVDKTVAKAKACFSNESGTKPLPGRQMLAKSLAMLAGSKFPSLLKTFDEAPPKTAKRQLAAALRANAHFVRPAFDLKSFGWRKAGAKAVAIQVAICRQNDVEEYLTETLSWRRTFRLALLLARRIDKEQEVFKVYSSERPNKALQAALRYFRYKGDKSDLSVWDMVKSRISEAEPRQLRSYLELTESVPEAIKAEYCFLVFLAFKKRVPDMERHTFSKIPAILPELDEKYIFETNDSLLEEYFPLNEMDYNKRKCTFDYTQIIAKFLILSTTENMLEERFSKVGLPLLNRLEWLWTKSACNNHPDQYYLDYFLFYLKYNIAYFNPKYVSCVPVLEKITEWMHGFLPIEKWFEKYVSVHLTMIYFKTVRHCINEHPELFEESKKLEGACMLGTIFGKFIANEIEEINKKYFLTITEVYAADLVGYFNMYFYRKFDESVEKFTIAVLNGLLSNKSLASCFLAKYALQQFRDRLKRDYVIDILNKFKESELKELCFAHAIE